MGPAARPEAGRADAVQRPHQVAAGGREHSLTWTGLSDPPTMPRPVDGAQPGRRLVAAPVHPRCNLRAARGLKSVIFQYSPWQPLPHSWDDWRAAAARPPDAAAES